MKVLTVDIRVQYGEYSPGPPVRESFQGYRCVTTAVDIDESYRKQGYARIVSLPYSWNAALKEFAWKLVYSYSEKESSNTPQTTFKTISCLTHVNHLVRLAIGFFRSDHFTPITLLVRSGCQLQPESDTTLLCWPLRRPIHILQCTLMICPGQSVRFIQRNVRLL